MPHVESLPKELRLEVLAWLDRVSVERSMSVSRRFRSAADALMVTGQVPLRILPHITFSSDAFFHEWAEFIQAFSTTSVEQLHFNRLSFCPLSPADFAKVLRLEGLRGLVFSQCYTLSAHFDNAFVSNFPIEGETRLFLEGSIPCDRSEFALNDEGILEYLFASRSNGTRWLELYNADATEELPRKIVEMKTRTEGARVAFRFRMFASPQKTDEYRRILDSMGLRRRQNAKGFFYRSVDAKIGFHITKNMPQPCFYANMSSE